ncbi:Uncharacterised protein [Mycobacteroides abscessus]|nr:Uncharacterised protein [Mycobacteroides abscessus]
MRSRSFCATSPEMVAAEMPRSTSADPTSSAAPRVRVNTIAASASDVARTRTREPVLWRNGTTAYVWRTLVTVEDWRATAISTGSVRCSLATRRIGAGIVAENSAT